mgnify:CR=1 FL=1
MNDKKRRPFTDRDRAEILAAARGLHGPNRCVYFSLSELPAELPPSEMYIQRACCIVGGRRAQPDDLIEYRSPGERK